MSINYYTKSKAKTNGFNSDIIVEKNKLSKNSLLENAINESKSKNSNLSQIVKSNKDSNLNANNQIKSSFSEIYKKYPQLNIGKTDNDIDKDKLIKTSKSPKTQKLKLNSNQSLLPGLLKKIFFSLIILTIFSVGSYFLYDEYVGKGNVAGITSEYKVQTIEERIAELVSVPESESPQILEIIDLEKARLKYNEFLKTAETGDLLVEYSNKIIIYRPSTDKIIVTGIRDGS